MNIIGEFTKIYAKIQNLEEHAKILQYTLRVSSCLLFFSKPFVCFFSDMPEKKRYGKLHFNKKRNLMVSDSAERRR